MAKTFITDNSKRNNDAINIIHLFEFNMRNLSDGSLADTLYFTDADLFVDDGVNEYIPLAVSFDGIKEDFSVAPDTISITLDNLNLGQADNPIKNALQYEWRNNVAKIHRIIYDPTVSNTTATIEGVSVPALDLNAITHDKILLFDGVIDTFSANMNSLTGTLTNDLVRWNKAFPSRTYNQSEFQSIVDTMTSQVIWGGAR